MQFSIGTMQRLHRIYPGSVSVPSRWAGQVQLFPQPLLRSSEHLGVPARATSHLFTWVSRGGLQVPQVSVMLPSCLVYDRMRLADTVSPRVNASPLKDRPSLITTAPWHHNQVLLLPLLPYLLPRVLPAMCPEAFFNPATAFSPLHCVMCICF